MTVATREKTALLAHDPRKSRSRRRVLRGVTFNLFGIALDARDGFRGISGLVRLLSFRWSWCRAVWSNHHELLALSDPDV
jgi:hypothetical protein